MSGALGQNVGLNYKCLLGRNHIGFKLFKESILRKKNHQKKPLEKAFEKVVKKGSLARVHLGIKHNLVNVT